VAADGTVYYTNAPTDPSFRSLAQQTGTTAGWLRLPAADPVATYGGHIKQAAVRYGVPERLVTAIIRAESDFNPRAVSSKGARGLMQLMPQTASMLGVRDSFDPGENIDGGVRHLRGLLDRFGSLSLAVAAYNAGEQAVTLHRGVPPYPETQGYVAKVLQLFNGGRADVAPAPSLSVIYRVTHADGTVVYTNIPPRGVR
jgi:soluble lytic murein transglycosylase-like protein